MSQALATMALQRGQSPTPQRNRNCHADRSDDAFAETVELVDGGARVLDLGCGRPELFARLQQRGCRVTAVLLESEDVEKVRLCCERVIIGDVEQADLATELKDERFDVVLAADVLPRLRDPARILSLVKGRLEAGGYLVATVPNVAHGSVRLALLRGTFCQAEVSRFGNAHIRFYTRESLTKLLEETGYAIGALKTEEREIEAPAAGAAPTPQQIVDSLSHEPDARALTFLVVAYPLPWLGRTWLQQRFQDWAAEKQALVRERDALHGHVLALADEIADGREAAALRARDAATALAQAHESARQERDHLNGRLDELRKGEQEWRDTLERLWADSHRRVEQLEGQLNAASEQCRRLAAERDHLAADRAAVLSECDRLRSCAQHLSADREMLLGQIRDLEHRLARIRASLPGTVYRGLRKCWRGMRRSFMKP